MIQWTTFFGVKIVTIPYKSASLHFFHPSQSILFLQLYLHFPLSSFDFSTTCKTSLNHPKQNNLCHATKLHWLLINIVNHSVMVIADVSRFTRTVSILVKVLWTGVGANYFPLQYLTWSHAEIWETLKVRKNGPQSICILLEFWM